MCTEWFRKERHLSREVISNILKSIMLTETTVNYALQNLIRIGSWGESWLGLMISLRRYRLLSSPLLLHTLSPLIYNLSLYLSINWSDSLSIHSFIHLLIYLCIIYLLTYFSIYLSIYLSIHLSIHPSIFPFIWLSICRSFDLLTDHVTYEMNSMISRTVNLMTDRLTDR